MRFSSFYHLLYFTFFFTLLHFGPKIISFGVTVSVTLQIIIFVYLIFSIFLKIKVRLDAYSMAASFYIIKMVVNPFIFINTLPIITDLVKYSLFPLIYIWLSNKNIDRNKLTNILYYLSIYAILSTIPFLLGFLSPLRHGYDLTSFGEEGGEGFIGIFYNTHMAAMSISFSLIIFIFFSGFKKSKKRFEQIFFYLVVFIGLIALYKTYIRTGYLMLFGGLFIYYLKTYNPRDFIKYIAGGTIIFIVITYQLSSDVVLNMRIFQNSVYSETDNKSIDINNYGSGRPDFWKASIDIWMNSSLDEELFGIGIVELQRRMEKKVGLDIGSHNLFIDTLVRNGLIGLIFLCYMLFILLLQINKFNKSKFYVLSISIYTSYILYLIVQGGPFLFTSLLLGVIFYLNNSIKTKMKNENTTYR